ncbi:MAG: AMP-binding protein [Acidimicrobiales bacterium]
MDVLASGTLPAAWTRSWGADRGARTLFFTADGDSPRWVTAGELDDRSRTAASKLAGLGLAEGSRVLWRSARTLDSVVACIAVLRAGLVLVPVDPGVTDRELRHVVAEVRPAVAIVDDENVATTIANEAASVAGGAGNEIVVCGMDLADLGPQVGDPVIDRSPPHAAALIGFTSGTTGAPKGAVLTHANMLANAEGLRLAWRWSPEDRLIHALPLFHGHGLCAALFGTLLAEASAVVLPAFDAGSVLDESSRHGATLFFGVPTMYHRIASSGRAGELSKLRLSCSGSAALPADLHRELERASGASVLERYGMTETLLTVSNPYDGERRPGSIGFPLPTTEAMIEDPESSDTASEGPGSGGPGSGGPGFGAELLVKGPTVFAGYFDKPAQTAEKLSPDGWFRTGDIGVVEDGYVRLLGRSTEMVITGGHNVYPAEVEDVLLTYPGVAEVAVSGTPSDEWGEVVTAWIVSTSGKLDVDGLLAHAAKGLSSYKRPRIVRQVDSLPRNSMGKVMRRSLS